MQIFAKIVLCSIVFAATAYGQEHPVGRATLSFDSPQWIAIEVPDKGVNYSGEIQGTVTSETRMFVNQTADKKFQALLIARVNKGGIGGGSGYFSYSPQCQDSQALLSEGNKGFNQSFAQCLLVYPLFTTTSLIKILPDNEAQILKSSRIILPDALQLISVHYANSNGSFVHARILLAPRFKGLVSPDQPSESPTIAWAKVLMKAAKDGVNSFSGRVKVPAIEFDNDSVEKSLVYLRSPMNQQ
jgi:hypothetical protein